MEDALHHGLEPGRDRPLPHLRVARRRHRPSAASQHERHGPDDPAGRHPGGPGCQGGAASSSSDKPDGLDKSAKPQGGKAAGPGDHATLWLSPGIELPTVSLLDTCAQSDLGDKAFLDAARPGITWRPATGTVRLEGVGSKITDERPRGYLSFCCSKQGPRFEVRVAVAELHNFGASLLLGRGTLEQLHYRFDMHQARSTSASSASLEAGLT